MKAIMYHYVRPPPEGLPYFRYLHLDDFRRQLDHFGKTHRFITQEEFRDALAGESAMPQGVLLTFDDGLKDHVDHVLPELVKRGLWGLFYVPTGPYQTGAILDVHRVHLLLGRHGGRGMLEALREVTTEAMLPDQRREEFNTLTYDTQDNDQDTTLFKRILNYFMEEQARSRVLDDLMAERFSTAPRIEDVYMARNDVQRIEESGSLLGSHGVNHQVMSRLSVARQEAEVHGSFAFLERLTGRLAMRSFCYPYGGFHSFTEETERILSSSGSLFSFNVEPRDVTIGDLRERPQALPRYDCNHFVFGRASTGEAVREQAFRLAR